MVVSLWAEADVQVRSLLVIGVDVVSLAASARRAGCRVLSVDYFGDQDLKHVCHESLSILKPRPGESLGRFGSDFAPEGLLRLTKDLLRKHDVDAALLSSGLDDQTDVLSEFDDLVPILGNRPGVIKGVRDKMNFFGELERLGIRHPETILAENIGDAREKSKDIGYPVIVKPSKSFGGARIREAQGPKELEQAFREAVLFDGEILIQEHISGTPASASLISSTNGVVTLTLNEQLLGMGEVGQREPFGYCGNVVPLRVTEAVAQECKRVVEKIALHFGLVGSNGVDLVVSEEGVPYVIEVNPRFQGTLECVERVLGINLVKAHVGACTQGRLPKPPEKTSGFCTRLILFAPQRSIVPNLEKFEGVRDIPLPGVVMEEGEPVCSIIAEGPDRDSSLRKAKTVTELICRSLQPQN